MNAISVKSKNEKMKIQVGICILCLENCDDFKAMDENTKNILDTLLRKIDFTAIQGPVLCKNCEDTLIKCFNFKTTCLHSHNYIASFLNNKDDIKVEMKDVYLSKNVTGMDVPEDQDVCGFCMGLVNNCTAISLDDEKADIMLEIMIKQCLPELDTSIIKKTVICTSCHGSLQDCFHFVTNCLIVEEKIKKYCATSDINRKGQIEINDLLQFTVRAVDGNLVDIIKTEEQLLCEDTKNPDEREIDNGGGSIKLEQIFVDNSKNTNNSFMEVNDRDINSEQKFTPKNMLAPTSESNKLSLVKIEETYRGENETKYKEVNRVEMKDEILLHNEDIEIKTDEHDFDRFECGIVLPQSEVTTGIYRREKCSTLNLGRDQLNPPLTKNHVSKIEMDQRELCSFQTKHEKPLVNHNLIVEGLKKLLPVFKDPSEVTMYNCGSCSFQARTKYYLKVHLLTHKDPSEVPIYKCGSCSFQSIWKYQLERHLIKHKDPSEVTMHKCDSCSFQTKRKYSLKTHMLVHKNSSEVTMYKCDSCSFQTIRKKNLKMHLFKHKDPSEVTMYKCDSCAFQAKYKRNFKIHLLKHKDPSEITMFECDSCSYQTKLKERLKTHLLIHRNPSEVTMYKCDSCSFQTRHKESLKMHLLTHKDPSEVTMYKCDCCLFQTKHKSNLTKHSRIHKDSSEVTVYKCESCSFQTEYKYGIKTHSLKHKDPLELTMYKCESCSFQTKYRQSLKKHSRRQHKDSLEVTAYKCDSCSFETKGKFKLKRHLLKHKDPSEVTMYKCEFCSFQTKYKCHVKSHLLKHKDASEVTMYKCESCLYQTKYKECLKKHLLKHKDPSEVTMYKCESCLFQTKYRECLKKHLLKHKDSSEVTINKCD